MLSAVLFLLFLTSLLASRQLFEPRARPCFSTVYLSFKGTTQCVGGESTLTAKHILTLQLVDFHIYRSASEETELNFKVLLCPV